VRSVALGEEFAVSGSYDLTIKVCWMQLRGLNGAHNSVLTQVWDRKTGALIADLNGGHTGRIFCVGFDCTKVRSPIVFLA
jgi:hypothetical protein